MTDAGADPHSAAALIAALGEVARLLEAGQAEAAAAEMAGLVGRYPAVSAGTLGPEQIVAARQLLDRCRAAEAKLRKKVNEEMGQVGASRKAHSAYR